MGKSVQEVLRTQKIDAILVTDPYNMRYISGFRGGEGTLYISEKNSVLITDSRYTEAAQQESDFTVVECSRNHKTNDIIRSYMEQEQAGRLDMRMKPCSAAPWMP